MVAEDGDERFFVFGVDVAFEFLFELVNDSDGRGFSFVRLEDSEFRFDDRFSCAVKANFFRVQDNALDVEDIDFAVAVRFFAVAEVDGVVIASEDFFDEVDDFFRSGFFVHCRVRVRWFPRLGVGFLPNASSLGHH